MKNNKKKGFTLMELLIVIAIIVVLVAIAIPVLTGALEKAREATDAANIRSAYAEVVIGYLDDGKAATKTVDKVQTVDGWTKIDGTTKIAGVAINDINSTEATTIAIDEDGNVTIDAAPAEEEPETE